MILFTIYVHISNRLNFVLDFNSFAFSFITSYRGTHLPRPTATSSSLTLYDLSIVGLKAQANFHLAQLVNGNESERHDVPSLGPLKLCIVCYRWT